MSTNTRIPTFIALDIACPLRASSANAELSSFNYQGTLAQGGQPANGSFEMQFLLYDSDSSGMQIPSAAFVNPVTVTDGKFNVSFECRTHNNRIDIRSSPSLPAKRTPNCQSISRNVAEVALT